MSQTKNPDEQPSAIPPSLEGPSKELPAAISPRKRLVQEVLITVTIHFAPALVVALASAVWLYFEKDPSVPPLVLLIFVALVISATYFALIGTQFFFPKDVNLSRRVRIHFIILAIIVVTVTAPLALTQSFTRARTNELMAQSQKLEKELESAGQAQKAVDSKRIELYSQVTDSLTRILHKSDIDSKDLEDILHWCIESISLNKPQVRDIRVAVVYLDKTKKYLVVPEHGYYGYDLDQDITELYFKVSPQSDEESDEAYRDRLGVAGWAYVKKQQLLAADVQTPRPGEGYRYKQFEATQQDKADRAMICVGIPDLNGPKEGHYVGVLSISSPTSDVFTRNDLAVAHFFATLLGRF
jgi:hypothetical protein